MSTVTWLAVNIDCPDPAKLAAFYHELSGLPLQDWGGGYFSLGAEGAVSIYFQPVEGYQPPSWPGQVRGQQMHLDFSVDDLDVAVSRAEHLGATQVTEQPGETWRVMLDPAGHPFCLSKGSSPE